MKKVTYIVFSNQGNRVYVNPRKVPENAVLVDTKLLPKGISPSFLKWNVELNKIEVMTRQERKLLIGAVYPAEIKEEYRRKYTMYFVLLLVIAGGAAILWQQYN